MNHSVEYNLKESEIRKIEFLVDEVCEKYRLNETYFGNILMSLLNILKLFDQDIMEERKIRIDVEKDKNLLIFNISDNGINYNYKKMLTNETLDLDEEREVETLFLIRSLSDKIELREDTIKLIFDLGKVLEPTLMERKKEFEKYYQLKRIELKGHEN